MATRTDTGRPRMSAEQRRASVLAAAVREFAHGGLNGTSTETIAARAGISQPYLFRLFPTKKELFLAVIRDTFARTAAHFDQAAAGLSGEAALEAMRIAYDELLADPTYLLIQLQSYAGCYDPEVQAETRTGYRALWDTVVRICGLPVDEVRHFFAYGMLLNVVAAMELHRLDEQWAQFICAPDSSLLGDWSVHPEPSSPD